MRNILAPSNENVLRELARTQVLLGFDFDGTLASIVRDPKAAQMRPRTRRLFAEVAAAYPCVVISGRARGDVLRRLEGIPLRAVVGNHGIETARTGQASRPPVERWARVLALRLLPFRGIFVENKGLSVAVHYRNCRRKTEARLAILEAVRSFPGATIAPGKESLSVLPKGAPDKGTALLALRRSARCRSAIFVGDDETDEGIFALGLQKGVLGIRVGRRPGSHAPYCIETQARIDALLARLLALRDRGAFSLARPPRAFGT